MDRIDEKQLAAKKQFTQFTQTYAAIVAHDALVRFCQAWTPEGELSDEDQKEVSEAAAVMEQAINMIPAHLKLLCMGSVLEGMLTTVLRGPQEEAGPKLVI